LFYTLNADALNTGQKINTSLKKYLQRLYGSPFLQQRRFITFLFFLVLSAAFWFIRSLGEEYETKIEYPVRYINFPENKVLVGDVPYRLHLVVRARGFSVLKSKLNLDLVPLQFNVSSFSLNSMGADTFYVVTETVKEVLSTELDDMTILDISPDTLFFRLTNIAVKKVGVLPVLSLHDKFFQQQFMINGKIETEPDSVIISGPATIINTITQVSTMPVSYTNLNDTAVGEIDIKPMDMITFSVQKVKVTIPVDRFTEVEDQLTVVPLNVPDSLNMIPIPGQIQITYRICLSNYNRIINNPLTPRIDYNAIKQINFPRLTIFLTDTPEFISNVQFNPKVTEFLITRK
jgi:hypothetical protein